MTTRKTIVGTVLCAALAIVLSSAAPAQNNGTAQGAYPTKPVKVTIGFPPGTPPETVGRMIADRFTELFGQTFLIDNRPGATGTIAATAVSQAPPDGYTLMVGVAASLAVAPHLLQSARYDPTRSFVPIGLIQRGPYFFIVRNDLPISNLKELVAYGRDHPGKLNFATPGVGSVHHLTLELFMQKTGARFAHVPFQGGGPMVTETVAGRTDVFLEAASATVVEYVKAGKLKFIGTTGETRSEDFPAVATAREQGVDLQSYSWWGLLAPAGTPAPIVASLNAALNKVLAEPAMVERLHNEGVPPQSRRALTPAQFAEFVADEYRRWGDVIRQAGVKVE